MGVDDVTHQALDGEEVWEGVGQPVEEWAHKGGGWNGGLTATLREQMWGEGCRINCFNMC